MIRRIALLFALTALASLFFTGSSAFAAEPDEHGKTEQILTKSDGDTTIQMRVFFDPSFSGDTVAVANDLASSSGFWSNAVAADTTTAVNDFSVRYSWLKTSMPIRIYYNPAFDISQVNPVTSLTESVSLLGSIQRGISAWNAVPSGGLSLAYAGTSTRTTNSCSTGTDGMNLIRFNALPDGVLGKTCTASRTGLQGTYIFEFDMEIATGVLWATDTVSPAMFDLDSVMLHELGHAFGLLHSEIRGAVMYPSIARGVTNRVPTADDIAGLQQLYGAGTPSPIVTPTPSPTPSPTATPAPTPTSTPSGGTFSGSVVPNSPYVPGVNSIVITSSGPASGVAARIAADSGRSVQALWLLTGGRWLFYLPSVGIDGGLDTFSGAVSSALAILN